MIIYTRKLGLAAYIKMVTGKINKIEDRVFYFESEQSMGKWEVEYLNSCCYRHDSELVTLRNMLNKGE